MFAADGAFGVYLSTDGGLTWTALNQGLEDKLVNALAIAADGTLYAGTSSGVHKFQDVDR